MTGKVAALEQLPLARNAAQHMGSGVFEAQAVGSDRSAHRLGHEHSEARASPPTRPPIQTASPEQTVLGQFTRTVVQPCVYLERKLVSAPCPSAVGEREQCRDDWVAPAREPRRRRRGSAPR